MSDMFDVVVQIVDALFKIRRKRLFESQSWKTEISRL